MFREMRRAKQQLSREECIEILKSEPRGILSVLGDDGYPYGLPMTHYYNEKTGTLMFHGAPVGHKADAMRACDKVSFCVHDEGYRKEGDWSLNIRSVIVFGRVRFIEDPEEMAAFCRSLCDKFTDDPKFFPEMFASAAHRMLCFEIVPEHMTGKLVNER